MKRTIGTILIVLALTVLTVSVAVAITNGVPDDGRHPYVGLLVFGDETDQGFVPYWRCSGSLLAPDVVLTAGHCTDGVTGARVWFDEGPVPWGSWDPDVNPTCAGESGYPCMGDSNGTPHTNPGFCIGCGNGLPGFALRDVGVVVLETPVNMDEYAQLPGPGMVDTLPNKTDLDLVGYGVQEQSHGGGPPRWTGLRSRLYAPSKLIAAKFRHSDEFIRVTMNPGGGTGGLCFGDSGGPDLLGGTNTVLAVNSYVTNYNCAGVGYSSRVDIPEVLNWIGTFLE